ncbi:MAG TPA: hypothetical protein VGP82_16830, partial [Ktedonobacterales bacterium]|nr:hypothetical protein [Ktedonobacterales bacterium]
MLKRGSLQASLAKHASIVAPDRALPVSTTRAKLDDALAATREFVSRDVVLQATGIWLATRVAYIVLAYYIG